MILMLFSGYVSFHNNVLCTSILDDTYEDSKVGHIPTLGESIVQLEELLHDQ